MVYGPHITYVNCLLLSFTKILECQTVPSLRTSTECYYHSIHDIIFIHILRNSHIPSLVDSLNLLHCKLHHTHLLILRTSLFYLLLLRFGFLIVQVTMTPYLYDSTQVLCRFWKYTYLRIRI